eukprot:TRINITY_DN9553_c0_g1_i1.p1 TRINITY_DN9553_c0_g1~~TRINITY_DN9553_c0_g1_i1.p1  ORF type:complete len:283 (-),score=35.22 TRINITY_DN9553_c0_g1_i1:288-1043(-)
METVNILDSKLLPHPEAEMCALPVPNGSTLYSGWFKHAKELIGSKQFPLATGKPVSFNLRVMCFQDQWSGEWSVPGGCTLQVNIQIIDESHLVIRNVVGKYTTELHASISAWGILHGEAIQDNVRGASFRLWPMTNFGKVQLPASCSLMTLFAAKVPTGGLALPPHDPNSTPEACSICLEGFLAGDWLKRTSCSELGVGHVFHQQCLDTWLEGHHTCPVCRHPLKDPDVSKDKSFDGDGQAVVMARLMTRI